MAMNLDINWKALIIGAAASASMVIIGSYGHEWAFLFASAGLLYVGYSSKDIKQGTILGALASTPIVYLTFQGALGEFTGYFFPTLTGTISVMALILLIGAFVGFVGAWAKRSRVKAKAEYEKKQNIGKNKNKNKKKNNN